MTIADRPGFLKAGGEMGAEIHAVDWSTTPLGPVDGWPQIVKGTLATWLDSPQPMFLTWGPGLRFFFNAAYRPFLGARQHGAIGRPFAELWADVWADIAPIVRKALEGEGNRFEDMPLTMTRNGIPEATWWTFTYMPLRDEAGHVVGMMGTTSEVTAKVLADRQAEAERERQRLLLQQMPGFVALLAGPGLVYEYVNDAFDRLFGPRQTIGRTVREAFPELAGQGVYERLERVYASGVPFVAESLPIRLRETAEERFIDVLYQPVRDSGQRITGLFVGGYDVSERVRAERALKLLNETLEEHVEERTAQLVRAQDSLRQAQKLEAVGRLTGGVAHDFNNLLTVIGTSVALLQHKGLPEHRRGHYLESIAETVRRAAGLTRQLLAFARRQPLAPTVFDVGAQVETAAQLIRPLVGSRVRIDLQRPDRPALAQADINQFETALLNLAVNASDAMEAEGTLAIRVEPVAALPAQRGQAAIAGDFVAISVTDHGTGIEASRLESVFEPFYTTKPVGKGTGLGLSQVLGFAQQSGGDVAVRSVVGEGTTFTVYLPGAATLAEPKAAADAPVARRAGRELRVLLVEDDENVGRSSREMLEDLGYATTWATNAGRALEMLDSERRPFDVVFSDVIMPGMNGVDLARAIRERHPALPVILTSGYSDVLAGEGTRGFPFVQKPYSADEVAAVIQRALGRRLPVDIGRGPAAP
jgi:PAS domain S-box-containing protein